MIMVGINAGTMVITRNSSVLTRMRRAGTGGTRAAVLTLGAAMAFASARAASADGPLFAWGSNTYGQCDIPAGLGVVTQISAGARHTLALKTDGTIVAWGTNNEGECDVPAGIGDVSHIAAGQYHAVAIKADGSLEAWGSNGNGQRDLPAGIGIVTHLSANHIHTVAIKADGSVAAWGWNAYGQCTVPDGLGTVTDVAAGFAFTLALNSDGVVTRWGQGPVTPPNPGSLTDIDAGNSHVVALKSDGTVACWGWNDYGQCDVPAGLGAVTHVAAGDYHTVVIKIDGSVAAWGRNLEGQCNVPAGLSGVTQIAAGFGHTIAVVDSDCDANSVPDSQELENHDCNGNRIHDACEAAGGALEDCNHNGLADVCEKQLSLQLASGHLGPIGFKSPASWTIPNAVLAAAPVTLRVRGHGDFSGQLESIMVRVGTLVAGSVLAGTSDCSVTPWASFTLPDSFFNAGCDAQGDVTIRADATVAVNSLLCPDGTWIEFELDYTGATPADCNANGLLDSCEIELGIAVDANNNGILDICESGLAACPADFDQNGAVDASDLAQILNAWGPAPGLPGLDLVPDGNINGADLAALLNAWGACAE